MRTILGFEPDDTGYFVLLAAVSLVDVMLFFPSGMFALFLAGGVHAGWSEMPDLSTVGLIALLLSVPATCLLGPLVAWLMTKRPFALRMLCASLPLFCLSLVWAVFSQSP